MIKTVFFLAALLLLLLAGCAPKHSIKKSEDTLQFFFHHPDATEVQFASSVDNFTVHNLNKENSGNWQIALLADSELKYFYIVDGSVYLPDCPLKETDDFGSQNCLYRP